MPKKEKPSEGAIVAAEQDGKLSKKDAKTLEDREMNEMMAAMGLQKPKHVGTATVNGLGLAAGGIAAGAVSLVALPYAGAKKSGVKGFLSGAAGGIVAAAALPVAGALAGATQVVRGAAQTPKAIYEASQGKTWSAAERRWVHYSLPDELERLDEEEAEMKEFVAARRRAAAAARQAKRVERRAAKLREREAAAARGQEGGEAGGEAGEAGAAAGDKSKKKKKGGAEEGGDSSGDDDAAHDLAYYEILEVGREAEAADIKRSYLRLARRMHPDKNPDDPEAQQKFQKLGEAYQVLSNEETRARYDEGGKEGLDGAQQGMLDPSMFYSIIFGSEGFEAFVGELQIAALLGGVAEEDEMSLRLVSHKQRMREATCAKELAALLAPFVDGDEAERAAFVARCQEKAAEMATTPFGELLTHVCGRMYCSRAKLHLQKADYKKLGGAGEAMRARGHAVKTNTQAAASLVSMYRAGRKMQGLGEGEEAEEAIKAQLNPKVMATMLEGAWHLAVVDVEGTLRKVCKKVLSDTSVSADARFQRALGLKALGETFLAAVSPENAADGPKKTFRQQLEAFASTMMPPSESAAAAAEKADSGGYVGLRVEIYGLVSKPELNGSFGVACGWDPEAGRYQVLLLDGLEATPGGSYVALKPANLRLHSGEVEEEASEP